MSNRPLGMQELRAKEPGINGWLINCKGMTEAKVDERSKEYHFSHP